MEVIASGFRQPSAVAVDASGAVLVADRAAGTLTRIGGDGARELLVKDLQGPNGVAVDRSGGVFVAEAAARRIVKIAAAGASTVVASLDGRPQAMAIDHEDRIWVAVRGRSEHGGGDLIVRVEPSGAPTEVAAGFKNIDALAAGDGALYVAMARLGDEHGRMRSSVARVGIREDGSASAAESLITADIQRVAGLAVDVLGALFAGGEAVDERHGRQGVVLKKDRAGQVAEFARGLRGAAALALAPDGDLIALEVRHSGRVLRFRSPPAPVLAAPPFANRTPLPIAGRVQPGDRVQLFDPSNPVDSLAATVADARGAFMLPAPLAPNARTELLFRATAAGGRGLAGVAAAAAVVHDDVLPRVFMLEPPAGAHVRGSVALRARAEDEGSGVATVSFLLDDAVVASVSNPEPPAPLLASAVLEPGGLLDGPHAWTAAAVDRAGNSRAEAQLLVVDRTPPETVVGSGPGAETLERTVRFGIEGIDVWSPSLEFSWRLDDGPWSAYSHVSTIELHDLAPGPHRFEARARDLAGNEDPTPAVRTFTVRALSIRITEPSATIQSAATAVWIRGTVIGRDVRVNVPLSVPMFGMTNLPALVENGAFVARVPVDPTTTEITVIATDATGATQRDSVAVTIVPATDDTSLDLHAWPPGGVAPLTVGIRLLNPIASARATLDVDGDGGIDREGEEVGVRVQTHTYSQAGVYTPTITVTDSDGRAHTARAVVHVYDRAALDVRLQAVWRGFRDALRTGDIAKAVSFIHSDRREAWSEYFNQLTPDELAQVDQMFMMIELVEVGFGGAQYEMLRERDGLIYSYAVWFAYDIGEGQWRLERF